MLKNVKLRGLHFGPGFLEARHGAHVHARDYCHQGIKVANVETLPSNVNEILDHPRPVLLLYRLCRKRKMRKVIQHAGPTDVKQLWENHRERSETGKIHVLTMQISVATR